MVTNFIAIFTHIIMGLTHRAKKNIITHKSLLKMGLRLYRHSNVRCFLFLH